MARGLRLLVDDDAHGPWNMGVDEALFETAANAGVATLRFYGWRGAWLSLGYAQRPGADRLRACESAGVGVVRRSTGGRAVLHGADLTYAVAVPEALLPGGVIASYEIVAGALVGALHDLGVAGAVSVPAPGPPGASKGAFDCFAEPAGHEIVLGEAKVCGSAQRRARGAVLQHGALRLRPDPPAAAAAAGGGAGTSLAEEGFALSRERLIERCAARIAAALGRDVALGGLEASERAAAARRGVEPPNAAESILHADSAR